MVSSRMKSFGLSSEDAQMDNKTQGSNQLTQVLKENGYQNGMSVCVWLEAFQIMSQTVTRQAQRAQTPPKSLHCRREVE